MGKKNMQVELMSDSHVAVVLRPRWPATEYVSGLRPEKGKKGKIRKRPPPENRKTCRKMENGPKPLCSSHFSSKFLAISFLVSGGGHFLYVSFFFYFGPEARNLFNGVSTVVLGRIDKTSASPGGGFAEGGALSP